MKKLYRSRADRKLCGICGGIGEYLGIDSTVVRLLWVLLSLMAFTGVIIYIIAAFIIPEQG
ncbi:MAG: PspC domain-containing protein [Clostridia bacterium]|nr:PspC domain-containing protein [Clostridia bacterium]